MFVRTDLHNRWALAGRVWMTAVNEAAGLEVSGEFGHLAGAADRGTERCMYT